MLGEKFLSIVKRWVPKQDALPGAGVQEYGSPASQPKPTPKTVARNVKKKRSGK